MKIEIWFDFVCPFCYLGETNFEKALAKFEHKEDVELVYRSFQLRMASEQTKGKDIHQVVAEKYHISYAQAKANNAGIAQAGSKVGLHYDFDRVKLNDSELAHQIMHYAKRVQKEGALMRRYFKAYFEEGLDIGDENALLKIAGESGLDIASLKTELAGSTLKAEVQKDETAARRLGINTIPYFVFNGKDAVSGAQDAEHFLAALKRAYATSSEEKRR